VSGRRQSPRSQRARWLPRLRGVQWGMLVALLAAFAALALGVAGAVSGLQVSLLWLPLFLGVLLLLGWALGASPAGAWAAATIAVSLGLPVIAFQVGNLGRPLLSLAGSVVRFARRAVVLQAWPGAGPVVAQWNALAGAVATLLRRLAAWAQGAGWTVRRRNRPLPALLPAMLLLAGALAVTGGRAFALLPALGLALVLRAGAAHSEREEQWRREAISFSPRFSRDVRWVASGLALALMVLALLVPSLSIYRLLDVARDLAQEERSREVARSLGLDAPAPAVPDDVFVHRRRGGLPTRHLIGSGPELSEEPVMAITVEQPQAVAGRLHYWRGAVYDHYTGRGWETRSTRTVTYDAGETAGAVVARQQPVRLEVRRLGEAGVLLYMAGTVVTVDRDFQVAWRARYPTSGLGADFFAASLAGAGRGGEPGDGSTTYRVDARVPLFGEGELRAVDWAIPAWMVDRYLALPESVSGRVRALARELTATEPTPYDRALAIERHLRHFPYTLALPAPPADKELADYFLFELQRGYCDYYATTMVVLARAAGLPARLATGYVGGAFDEGSSRYLVTADLAHSWPEVYFPGYGWIPFEPTAGRTAIERPEAEAPGLREEVDLEPITAQRSRALRRRALGIGAGLRSLPPERALRRLFAYVQRSGRRMEVGPEAGETAHEFAGRLNARLLAMAADRRRARALASAPEAVEWLADIYTRSLFSPYAPPAEQKGQAIGRWLRLHFQLSWAVVLWHSERVAGRLRSGRPGWL